MPENTARLISLNGEYIFLSVDNTKYAPLRVNEHVAEQIQTNIKLRKPESDSCIQSISSESCDNKVILTTSFRATTKCTSCLYNPSTRTKSEMCLRKLCNGKCTDNFMRNTVGKHIFPDLYNTKQK